jgi:putative FmdB family regulatory protein
MPIYEYRCEKGHEFEAQQSIREAAIKKCPRCRGKSKRLVSMTSFILKGNGWAKDGYETGIKAKNKRAPERS